MYKIDENFEIQDIKDNTINQISFGLNIITLYFNKGFIQFSGSFSFKIDNEKVRYDEVFPVRNDYRLLQLLEKKIVLVKINKSRDILTLKFEEEIILELIGNNEYESYTLNVNGKEMIV